MDVKFSDVALTPEAAMKLLEATAQEFDVGLSIRAKQMETSPGVFTFLLIESLVDNLATVEPDQKRRAAMITEVAVCLESLAQQYRGYQRGLH